MGLKEELAELKKAKLSASLPPAQGLNAVQEKEKRDSFKEKTISFSQPDLTSTTESEHVLKTDSPTRSGKNASATSSKTIPIIAQEIMREVEQRKKGGSAKTSKHELFETSVVQKAEEISLPLKQSISQPPIIIAQDKVLQPPKFEERKSIVAIAEQIIAEKKSESEPVKSIEEMMEQPKGEAAASNLAQTSEQTTVEKASAEVDNTPRKPLPAIAEEIRKEIGIVEKKNEPAMPQPPAPPYATSPIPNEMIDRLAEAKEKASTPEPKRLYLLKTERKEAQTPGERVPQATPHRRMYNEKGEASELPEQPAGFEDMVSEVYVQVKREEERERPIVAQEKREEVESDEKRREDDARRQFEERRRQRDARKLASQPQAKPVEADQTPKSLTIEELLGEKPGDKTKASGLFGELEKETTGSGEGTNLFAELDEAAKPPAAKKQAEFTVVAKEKGCPNCKIAATKIVYCPYCGGAMCANCATKITPYPDHFTYVCPHCSEEVEVKKKAG